MTEIDQEAADEAADRESIDFSDEDEIAQYKGLLRDLRRRRRREHIEQLPYTLGEEIANAITHGLGWLFGVVALVALLWRTIPTGDPWQIASAAIYGTSLILLYCASTMYHALTAPRARRVFKVLDHSSIYLLIAGSYTPFLLLLVRDEGGLLLCVVVWTIAVVGIVAEAFWVNRPRWLSIVVYLGMGWLAIFLIGPIRAALPPEGLWLLVGGGIAYTAGTIFYGLKKVPYMHSLWHLWVLAGSIMHFAAVWLYVLD